MGSVQSATNLGFGLIQTAKAGEDTNATIATSAFGFPTRI